MVLPLKFTILNESVQVTNNRLSTKHCDQKLVWYGCIVCCQTWITCIFTLLKARFKRTSNKTNEIWIALTNFEWFTWFSWFALLALWVNFSLFNTVSSIESHIWQLFGSYWLIIRNQVSIIQVFVYKFKNLKIYWNFENYYVNIHDRVWLILFKEFVFNCLGIIQIMDISYKLYILSIMQWYSL